MNVATTNTKKSRTHLDPETRAALIRKVRENSVVIMGRRELRGVGADHIADMLKVRRPYVYTALYTLRRLDAEDAAKVRAEKEKRKAEEEISAAMREAASAPTQQELLAQFEARFVSPPDLRDVVDLIRSVETKVMLAIDRLDRLANRLPAKWR